MSILRVGPAGFLPRLVIFDKDGTLIDFHFMWASWITGLGQRLDSISGHTVSPQLFHSFGFDYASSRVAPDGPLAVWSMAALKQLAEGVLRGAGIDDIAVGQILDAAWLVPDPVGLARPLADLERVFRTLHANQVQTAIATSDDRGPTESTLAGLGIARYIDAVVGADDNLPLKPAPDMVLYLSRTFAVAPEQTVVVGDAAADLLMGRAAKVGLVVGVLSGVGSAEVLAPHADILIPSVGELV